MDLSSKIIFFDEVLMDNKMQQEKVKTLLHYADLDDLSKIKLLGLAKCLKDNEKEIERIKIEIWSK